MSERATVVMLHGSGSERLRQALSQGLVRKEVQADIENALAGAQQAQEWADTLAQQNWELQNQLYNEQSANRQLHQENQRLAAEMRKNMRNYEKALKDAQEEKERRKNRREMRDFFLATATIFLGTVAAIFAGITLFYVTWIR